MKMPSVATPYLVPVLFTLSNELGQTRAFQSAKLKHERHEQDVGEIGASSPTQARHNDADGCHRGD